MSYHRVWVSRAREQICSLKGWFDQNQDAIMVKTESTLVGCRPTSGPTAELNQVGHSITTSSPIVIHVQVPW